MIIKDKLSLIWPYSAEDKKTWKYIDLNIYKSVRTGEYVVKWVNNPDFKYSHLDVTN